MGSSTKQTKKGHEYFLRYYLGHRFFKGKKTFLLAKKLLFKRDNSLTLCLYSNPSFLWIKITTGFFFYLWLSWEVVWQYAVVSLRNLGRCRRKELVNSPDTDEESVQISIIPGSQCGFSSPDLLGRLLCFYNCFIICHYKITADSETHNQKSRVFLRLMQMLCDSLIIRSAVRGFYKCLAPHYVCIINCSCWNT